MTSKRKGSAHRLATAYDLGQDVQAFMSRFCAGRSYSIDCRSDKVRIDAATPMIPVRSGDGKSGFRLHDNWPEIVHCLNIAR